MILLILDTIESEILTYTEMAYKSFPRYASLLCIVIFLFLWLSLLVHLTKSIQHSKLSWTSSSVRPSLSPSQRIKPTFLCTHSELCTYFCLHCYRYILKNNSLCLYYKLLKGRNICIILIFASQIIIRMPVTYGYLLFAQLNKVEPFPLL